MEKSTPYPKSIFFLIGNVFCERFSYYGMRTILSLYLVYDLLYSEQEAKVIFHASTMLVYFSPLIGAILADSIWGKYRTILYVSCIYAIGNLIVALGATPFQIPSREATIVGLFLMGVGSGGIKPCVPALGGDQFVLPQQKKQLDWFFSIFYFTASFGSCLSVIISPILREHVHCYGKDSCYPLAFAIPGFLMITAVLLFICGKNQYTLKQPEENVFLKVAKCVTYAINEKWTSSRKTDHWLDFSKKKYGPELVNDIKVLINYVTMILPIPMFWALYDQQGSVWVFQSSKMNGNVGFFTIPPEQIYLVNPILILVLIPIFDCKIYPFLKKWNLLTTHLQRMITGGFLMVAVFLISGFISLKIENDLKELSSISNEQIFIYNSLDCDVSIKDFPETIQIEQFDHLHKTNLSDFNNQTFDYNHLGKNGSFHVSEKSSGLFFYHLKEDPIEFFDDRKISVRYANVRNLISTKENITLRYIDALGNTVLKIDNFDYGIKKLIAGKYTLQVNDNVTLNVDFHLGDVYTVMASLNKIKIVNVAVQNRIHMVWLLPQLILLTIADILVMVTGMKFSYSQTPSSMRTVGMGCWLLTIAAGNLIIVIIEAVHCFENQSSTTFMYSGLMLLDLALLIVLARRYQYYKTNEQQ